MPWAKASSAAAAAESVVAWPAMLRVRNEDDDQVAREKGAGPVPPFFHSSGWWWHHPPAKTTVGSVTTSTAPVFWTLHPTSLTSVESVLPTQQSPSPHDTRATNMTSAMSTTDSSPTSNTGGATESVTDSPKPTASSSQDASGLGSNRTLVITLSTVLSVVGVLLIAGGVLICLKYRRRRLPRFARGISPIDDDEIETWKMSRGEKASFVGAPAAVASSQGNTPAHARNASTNSVKKPPSVIVYPSRHSQNASRHSGEGSPRSMYNSYGAQGKTSFDKELPKTPVQAMAPNARAGLTDDAIPGDDPFVQGPKRHPSRLSKAPPVSSSRSIRSHKRARSSRSSMRSFGDYYAYYAGSDVDVSPRGSHECLHSRIYSSSSIPPRLSLGDDALAGGLSPRPLFRDDDIGRAIG